jgi:Glycosyl hydrolase family 115/Gylcosyl hydrolase family 115 C-terminal domain
MEFGNDGFMDEWITKSRRDEMLVGTRVIAFLRTPLEVIYEIAGISLCVLLILLSLPMKAFAIGEPSYITFDNGEKEFPLSVSGKSAPICVSSKDYSGVRLIVDKYFCNDIGRVTGTKPEISIDAIPKSKEVVIVGTIGKSPLIDELIAGKKIDVSGIEGEWESYLIQPVDNPFPGVDRALVVAGSDKRGTIYGMFDISEQIGVSPWYWWADVPVRHHDSLYVLPGRHTDGPPSVKYRGIFLNDEWPDLTDWVIKKYGFAPTSENPPVPRGVANYGHEFYEHIFELLLRLKANYLWPAMWNNAFNEDDTLNPKLANEYGIVMGTSHQEPMLRAQKEWDRRYMSTLGPWNYAKFPDTLNDFWRKGIKRNKNYQSIVTIGLRGENDTPMASGGLDSNMDLLENIIAAQRKILAEEMNPDVTKIPQLWCPYKEVMAYYNAGMRVPDDVTMLWTDDNWGNIRRLPTTEERARSGGAGVYYHFDYHGGPRNYQWINTNPISKIWDQMSLAKQYGADRIWIVNVGHLKGYELPISYFMDLAWNANRWTNSNIDEYTRLWAQQQFGSRYADQIADILEKYTKYNGRHKPELLSPTTYSLVHYREAEKVVSDFKDITDKAEGMYNEIPESDREAFYELVLFPTKASGILNEMYYAAGRNELYAKQGRASTNDMAAETRSLFSADTSLMSYFNHTFAGGKWDHFMDQPVIGYTGWNQPQENNLGAINLTEVKVPHTASMAVAVEGSGSSWPIMESGDGTPETKPTLPQFDSYNRQTHYIDIFNRGSIPFDYSVRSGKYYVRVSSERGRVKDQRRIYVSVNWKRAPKGRHRVPIFITQNGRRKRVVVYAQINNPIYPNLSQVDGFVEGDGYVSIEAAHYTKRVDAGTDRWIAIEDYGNTLSGMRATSSAKSAAVETANGSARIEYKMFLFNSGKVDVDGIFSPTLNFMPGRALRYAISFDNSLPDTVTLVPADYVAGYGKDWEKSVENNVRHSVTSFTLDKPGYHTLKVWMVDPGVVLEKIIVDLGGVKPSYLGPPESFHRNVSNVQEQKN